MMLCGWVTIDWRRRHSGIPTYGFNGLEKGCDCEQPAYVPLHYYGIFTLSIPPSSQQAATSRITQLPILNISHPLCSQSLFSLRRTFHFLQTKCWLCPNSARYNHCIALLFLRTRVALGGKKPLRV